jgi:hypothetical protein
MFGMNLLVFIVLAWMAVIATALMFDFGPEIYREHKTAWQEKHAKAEFIPKPERKNWGEVQIAFSVIPNIARPDHRRHARVPV